MTEFTTLQQQVFEAAKVRLQGEPWYKGVCCDDFPTDHEIADNFDGAVSAVVSETAMWDDPDFFSGG
jgi:hypothetical protein